MSDRTRSPGGIQPTATTRRRCPPPYDPKLPWRALRWNGDGSPVRWDSTNPIRWAFNADAYPKPRQAQLVREAMTMLAGTTGFVISETDPVVAEPDEWLRSSDVKAAEVLVSLANIDLQNHSGKAAGTAAADAIELRPGVHVYRLADIRLRASVLTLGVALHEAMHALGLGHVGSRSEIMYWGGTAQAGFGRGDLAGLQAVSRPIEPPATSSPNR